MATRFAGSSGLNGATAGDCHHHHLLQSSRVPVQTPSHPVLVRLVAERLHRHNRSALGFAFLSAAGSVICWAALYFVAQWLGLLGMTIVRGSYVALPAGFAAAYTAIAGALLFWAWLDRKVTPNDLPRDEQSAREIAIDLILAIPRMTLAIGGNLSAWQRLGPHEIEDAAHLLGRVCEQRRLPIHEAPLEIPEAERRGAVITALTLLGLLEFHHAEDGVWLRVPACERESLGVPTLA